LTRGANGDVIDGVDNSEDLESGIGIAFGGGKCWIVVSRRIGIEAVMNKHQIGIPVRIRSLPQRTLLNTLVAVRNRGIIESVPSESSNDNLIAGQDPNREIDAQGSKLNTSLPQDDIDRDERESRTCIQYL
jgi:hypothetical protein